MKNPDNKFSIFFLERLKSFKHAWDGWKFVLKTQQNAWIHLAATILVILMSLWLRIQRADWIAILLVIGIVWTAEFFNTAMEAVVDLVSPEKHPLAKIGKDVGAAAVLIAAGMALAIGLIILGPSLLAKLGI